VDEVLVSSLSIRPARDQEAVCCSTQKSRGSTASAAACIETGLQVQAQKAAAGQEGSEAPPPSGAVVRQQGASREEAHAAGSALGQAEVQVPHSEVPCLFEAPPIPATASARKEDIQAARGAPSQASPVCKATKDPPTAAPPRPASAEVEAPKEAPPS